MTTNASTAPGRPPSPAPRPLAPLLACLLLAAAALLAYANSFQAPFVFDDEGAITNNPAIRRLWPLGDVLFPPQKTALEGGLTSSGRPMVNLSLALNHAISGENTWSYHAVNFLIHLGAGLLLFGIVRRTLVRPVWQRRFGEAAVPLGLAVAALWTLHPLQTESVTYTVQRAESLMGFFYLLTLYAFVRGVEKENGKDAAATGRPAWFALSATACLLGMATKEVIVSAPLMVLLYDRTFVAGTFREAWKRRRRLYVALIATWIPLGALVWSTGGNRGGTVGFNLGIPWWSYALTQFEAVTRYVGLSIWPRPLVFEYGRFWVRNASEVLPYATVVLPLLTGTVIALWRRPVLGFAGAWFFVLLAPTSLVPSNIQMIAEHRMYLSLAAVMAVLVLGGFAWAGRRAFAFYAPAAVAFTALTFLRNEDYRSEVNLWADTVAKRPDNALAQYNLGHALAQAGRPADAVPHYEAAVELRPGPSEVENPLGGAIAAVIRRRPEYAEAHNNLGNALTQLGSPTEAIAHYETAIQLQPDFVSAHYNLGSALVDAGRLPEAIEQFEIVLQHEPAAAEVHFKLGNAYARLGRMREAATQYEESARLDPTRADALINLGSALLRLDRAPEAIARFQAASQLDPKSAAAQYDLANALLGLDRLSEAITHYEEASRLQPDLAGAHHNLALALVRLGRPVDAVPQYEETLRLMPNSAQAHHNLALALAQLGRVPEAIEQDRAALQLQPDFPEARAHLDQLRRK